MSLAGADGPTPIGSGHIQTVKVGKVITPSVLRVLASLASEWLVQSIWAEWLGGE